MNPDSDSDPDPDPQQCLQHTPKRKCVRTTGKQTRKLNMCHIIKYTAQGDPFWLHD